MSTEQSWPAQDSSMANSWRTPSHNTIRPNTALCTVEVFAHRFLALIRRVLEELRSVPEFQPSFRPQTTTIRLEDPASTPAPPLLLTRIEQQGILAQLQELVEEWVHFLSSALPLSSNAAALQPGPLHLHLLDMMMMTTTTTTPPDAQQLLEENSRIHQHEQQRCRLVQKLFWPLLTGLGQVYQLLDEVWGDLVPAPPPPPQVREEADLTQLDESSSSSSSPVASKTRASPSRPPPPPTPPVAMLSLAQYTHVACLMELTVDYSILPGMSSDHILIPCATRARYHLPKALAAQLPPAGWTWADRATRTSPEEPGTAGVSTAELAQTTTVLAALLGLDRFRPMLLGRHLTDLYAAMLQVHQSISTSTTPPISTSSSSSSLDSQHVRRLIWARLMPQPDPGLNDLMEPPLVVEAYQQAQTYQTLLRQGRQAPAWLRQRVASLLTHLARRDLGSVVPVFVQAAPPAERSAAALRLAQALTLPPTAHATSPTSPDEHHLHHYQLAQQVLVLLDGIRSGMTSIEDLLAHGPPEHDQATLQFIWALVARFPSPTVEQSIVVPLRLDLLPAENGGSTPAIVVDGQVPQLSRLLERCGILLSCVPPGEYVTTIVRIFMSVPSVEPSTLSILDVLVRIAAATSVLHIKVKSDSILMLRALMKALLGLHHSATDRLCGVDVAAGALVFSIGGTDWDQQGNRLAFSVNDELKVERSLCDSAQDEFDPTINNMESRARAVVHHVLVPMTEEATGTIDAKRNLLASKLFQLSLLLYLPTEIEKSYHSRLLNQVRRHRSVALVPLVLLPQLCEVFSPDILVLSESDNRGLFDLMSLTFAVAAARWQTDQASVITPSPILHDDRFGRVMDLLASVVPAKSATNNDGMVLPPAGAGLILSMSSILLSVLVSILELGSKKRSEDDEHALASLSPALATMAELSPGNREDDESDSRLYAEVADMASHAGALLATRGASSDYGNNAPELEDADPIRQSEIDLVSTEPPIRARGIVRLRHVVSRLDERGDYLQNTDRVLRALSIAIRSLQDKDSFVFLAGVHTIANISDILPSLVVRNVADGVATGGMTIQGVQALSNDQRIKLAEALIFILRRRAAHSDFAENLCDRMLYGEPTSPNIPTAEQSRDIQKKTHEYFFPTDADDEVPFASGGPIFDIEENDLVQASRISVCAELLAVIPSPSLLRNRCRSMVACATHALRQGYSRPIRRAGALLARELYSAILRESNGVLDQFAESFVVAAVSGHEDSLAMTLDRCIAGYDRNDIPNAERLDDPALVARCSEALFFRGEADKSGILAAARLVGASIQVEDIPIVRLLRDACVGKDNRGDFRLLLD